MAHIKHGSKTYPIPTGGDAKTTFESLKQVMPELSNAKLTGPDKSGNYTAQTSYGRKG